MEKIDKILVPVDFSVCSESSLRYAFLLAHRLKATLLLMHVITPLAYPIDFALALPAAYRRVKRGLGKELEKLAARGRKKGIPTETYLLKGTPEVEITRAAEYFKCDLIVIGTHGRKGTTHFLKGSVAEKVIRTASVPVVTIRMKAPPGTTWRKKILTPTEAIRRTRRNRTFDKIPEKKSRPVSFS
ncbi:MAG TPA: universal stress protein [Candidatus Manganitrophaceae bacterium]|nr:universal stress protein [Candidatus Manganitrophaceae bacterium]